MYVVHSNNELTIVVCFISPFQISAHLAFVLFEVTEYEIPLHFQFASRQVFSLRGAVEYDTNFSISKWVAWFCVDPINFEVTSGNIKVITKTLKNIPEWDVTYEILGWKYSMNKLIA